MLCWQMKGEAAEDIGRMILFECFCYQNLTENFFLPATALICINLFGHNATIMSGRSEMAEYEMAPIATVGTLPIKIL